MGWLENWFSTGWFGTTSIVDVTIEGQNISALAANPPPTVTTGVVVSTGSLTINSLALETSISTGLSIKSEVLGNNFLPAVPTVVAGSSVKPEVLGAGVCLDVPNVVSNALVNPGLLIRSMAGREPAVNLGTGLSLAAINVNLNLLPPKGSGSGEVFLNPVFLETLMSPIIFKAEVKLNIDPVVGYLGVAQRKIDVTIDI
jgi:hypothetical protein